MKFIGPLLGDVDRNSYVCIRVCVEACGHVFVCVFVFALVECSIACTSEKECKLWLEVVHPAENIQSEDFGKRILSTY